MQTTDRRSRGLGLLESIQGPDAGEVYAGLRGLSPDFADYVLEAGFADVYGRPGLDLAQRQLINVAVLTAVGGCEPQLGVHVRGALHVGVSPEEIVEAIFHVALYAGHPRSLNGLRVAVEIFDQMGIPRPEDRGQRNGRVT